MGYLHSRRVCLNLLAEGCARVPVAVCMCWLYAGYSLGRGGSTLPAMWFLRLRIGTGSSAAARSARLRCISIDLYLVDLYLVDLRATVTAGALAPAGPG